MGESERERQRDRERGERENHRWEDSRQINGDRSHRERARFGERCVTLRRETVARGYGRRMTEVAGSAHAFQPA